MSELVADEELKKTKVRKNMIAAEKYEHFIQETVVRGTMVKVSYFQEQGFGVFLEKLKA